MRGIVLTEGVITLATHEKISLIIVAFNFLQIFILMRNVAAFLSPVGTDFLRAQPKLFPVRETYLSISAREKKGIFCSEIPHPLVG